MNHKVQEFISYLKNPTPENKIATPDANNTESKPLSRHFFTKYATNAKSDISQSHFKYFIYLN